MANSFRFFTNYLEVIKSLPKSRQMHFLEGMVMYATEGVEPDFTGTEAVAFTAMRYGLRKSRDISEARREAGRKGAESRWSEDGKMANDSKENFAIDDGKMANDSEYIPSSSSTSKSIGVVTLPNLGDIQRTETKKFRKPTESELADYIAEKGFDVDPAGFIAYYDSVGWKVGKNPMKDWRAAVRTWHYRNNPKPKGGDDGVDGEAIPWRNAVDILGTA